MTASLSPPPGEVLDARAYHRAHNGKLMVINRAGDRERSSDDFFYFDAVGTHPTGLLVTGRFANDCRKHMRAEIVRDASEEEIAWRNSLRN